MNTLALAKTEESNAGEVAVYNPFRQQLAEIKQHNFKLVFDYADPKGNKEARSHVYKLRQTKAAIEKARKAEKAASLEYGRKVDAEAQELVAEVEEMIEVHDKPLREHEAAEETRQAAIRQRIANMTITADFIIDKSAADLKARRDEIAAVEVDESFGEFSDEAMAARLVAIDYLAGAIINAGRREAEAAELQRLRDEAEARRIDDERKIAEAAAAQAEKDHTERVAAEKKAAEEEAARVAAEEAARLEREREAAAEAERKRVEAEAAERERLLREQAEAAEREKQAVIDKAARDAAEAEARRVKEAEEAEARRVREAAAATAREEKARQDERDRLQREADTKTAEDAKREADKKHRGAIHTSIVDAIVGLDKGITKEQAQATVVGICGDLVPNIKIIY